MTCARVVLFSIAILGAFNVLLFAITSSAKFLCPESLSLSIMITGFVLGENSLLKSSFSSASGDVRSLKGSLLCSKSDFSWALIFSLSRSPESAFIRYFSRSLALTSSVIGSFKFLPSSVSLIKAYTRSSPSLSFKRRNISLFFSWALRIPCIVSFSSGMSSAISNSDLSSLLSGPPPALSFAGLSRSFSYWAMTSSSVLPLCRIMVGAFKDPLASSSSSSETSDELSSTADVKYDSTMLLSLASTLVCFLDGIFPCSSRVFLTWKSSVSSMCWFCCPSGSLIFIFSSLGTSGLPMLSLSVHSVSLPVSPPSWSVDDLSELSANGITNSWTKGVELALFLTAVERSFPSNCTLTKSAFLPCVVDGLCGSFSMLCMPTSGSGGLVICRSARERSLPSFSFSNSFSCERLSSCFSYTAITCSRSSSYFFIMVGAKSSKAESA